MEADKLDYFKRRLLKRKRQLEEQLADLEERFSLSQQESASDLSNLPTHMADLASDSESREECSYLIDSTVEELHRVNNALDKIYSDTYGICEKCGYEIHFERLKAIPYAELCIKCGKR